MRSWWKTKIVTYLTLHTVYIIYKQTRTDNNYNLKYRKQYRHLALQEKRKRRKKDFLIDKENPNHNRDTIGCTLKKKK